MNAEGGPLTVPRPSSSGVVEWGGASSYFVEVRGVGVKGSGERKKDYGSSRRFEHPHQLLRSAVQVTLHGSQEQAEDFVAISCNDRRSMCRRVKQRRYSGLSRRRARSSAAEGDGRWVGA